MGRGKGWNYNRNMSVNATIAYSNYAPISKWDKALFVKQFEGYFDSDEEYDEAIEIISQTALAKLKTLLEYKEWHHIGIFKKAYDFYGLKDGITLDEMKALKNVKVETARNVKIEKTPVSDEVKEYGYRCYARSCKKFGDTIEEFLKKVCKYDAKLQAIMLAEFNN